MTYLGLCDRHDVSFRWCWREKIPEISSVVRVEGLWIDRITADVLVDRSVLRCDIGRGLIDISAYQHETSEWESYRSETILFWKGISVFLNDSLWQWTRSDALATKNCCCIRETTNEDWSMIFTWSMRLISKWVSPKVHLRKFSEISHLVALEKSILNQSKPHVVFFLSWDMVKLLITSE